MDNSNVAIGYKSLYNSSGGINNVAIGTQTLMSNTTGDYNTALGSSAGYTNTTGYYNTFLGANTDISSNSTINNSTAIGYGSKIDSSNKIVLGTSSETVSIPGNIVSANITTYPSSNIDFSAISVGIDISDSSTTTSGGNITSKTLAFNKQIYTLNIPSGNNYNVTISTPITIDVSGVVTANVANGGATPNFYVSVNLSSYQFQIIDEDSNTIGTYNATLDASNSVSSLTKNYDMYFTNLASTTGSKTFSFNSYYSNFYYSFDIPLNMKNDKTYYIYFIASVNISIDRLAGGNNVDLASITSTLIANTSYSSLSTSIQNSGTNTITTSDSAGTNYKAASVLQNTTSIEPVITSGKTYVNDLMVSTVNNTNITGDSTNIALGYQSLYKNTTGIANVALGSQALYNSVVDSSNVAIGYQSLYNCSGGMNNVAIGTESMVSNTTGDYNIALGNQALYSNVNTICNVAVGHQSLYNSSGGVYNVAIGTLSMGSNTTGDFNTSLGHIAGYSNTTGQYNTFLGANTDISSNSTINHSTAIGFGAKIDSSNQIVLGTASETVSIPGNIVSANITTTKLLTSNFTIRPVITTLTGFTIDATLIQSYSTFIFNSESTTITLEALGASYDGCLINIRFQNSGRNITRGASLTNMCASGASSNSASFTGLENHNFVFLYLHSYGGGGSGLTTGPSMIMINNV